MKRLLPLGVLAAAVFALPSRGGDLPTEAEKRLKQFEEERTAIRKEADTKVLDARAKLVRDLTALKELLAKDGKAADAQAVADKLATFDRDILRSANLLVNGSFEEGAEPGGGGFTTVGVDGTALKGWKVTAGSVDHIDTYWKAAHGGRSLDLNGNDVGAISQTFKTVKGQKYAVSFALAANFDSGADSLKVKVSAAGKAEEFTFEKKEVSKENMGWVIKTWEFTATDDETTLDIASLHTDEAFCGPALDDVIVVPAGK